MATRLNQISTGFVALISWGLVLLVMWSATPATIRPIGVTLWFLALLVALTSGLAFILDIGKRVLGPKKPQGRSFTPSLRQGFLLGLWGVIMLGLSSLHQFSLRDLFLSGLLFVIIEIYTRLT